MNEGITFDDVLLQPQFSDIKSRKTIDIGNKLSSNYFRLPIISSPMDTVSGPTMCSAMDEFGGLGIIHRYNTIEQQCNHPVDSQLLKPSSCCAETNTQYNYYKHADTPSQGGTDNVSKNVTPPSESNVPEAFNL